MSTTHWDVFLSRDLSKQRGLSTEQVQQAFAEGQLLPNDLIRPAGQRVDWTPLDEMRGELGLGNPVQPKAPADSTASAEPTDPVSTDHGPPPSPPVRDPVEDLGTVSLREQFGRESEGASMPPVVEEVLSEQFLIPPTGPERVEFPTEAGLPPVPDPVGPDVEAESPQETGHDPFDNLEDAPTNRPLGASTFPPPPTSPTTTSPRDSGPNVQAPNVRDAGSPPKETATWAPAPILPPNVGLFALDPGSPRSILLQPLPPDPAGSAGRGSESQAKPGSPRSDIEDDDFTLTRGRTETVEEIELAAMVDVAFQLILFFLVTATVVYLKTLNVPTPDPDEQEQALQQVQPPEDQEDDTILVRIDESSEILVDDELVAPDVDALIEALRRARDRTGRTLMLLDASYQTPHRIAILAVDAANEIGLAFVVARPQPPADF